jgi:hypothetical protein
MQNTSVGCSHKPKTGYKRAPLPRWAKREFLPVPTEPAHTFEPKIQQNIHTKKEAKRSLAGLLRLLQGKLVRKFI